MKALLRLIARRCCRYDPSENYAKSTCSAEISAASQLRYRTLRQSIEHLNLETFSCSKALASMVQLLGASVLNIRVIMQSTVVGPQVSESARAASALTIVLSGAFHAEWR